VTGRFVEPATDMLVHIVQSFGHQTSTHQDLSRRWIDSAENYRQCLRDVNPYHLMLFSVFEQRG
jgi:hypothetical protein